MNNEQQDLYYIKLAVPTLCMILAYGLMHVPFCFLIGLGGFLGSAITVLAKSFWMARNSLFPIIYSAIVGGLLITVHRYTGLFDLTLFGHSLGPYLWYAFLGCAGAGFILFMLQLCTKPIREKLAHNMVWVWFALAFTVFGAGLALFSPENALQLPINENHVFHMVAYAGMFVTGALFAFFFSFYLYCLVSPNMRRFRAEARSASINSSDSGDTEQPCK